MEVSWLLTIHDDRVFEGDERFLLCTPDHIFDAALVRQLRVASSPAAREFDAIALVVAVMAQLGRREHRVEDVTRRLGDVDARLADDAVDLEEGGLRRRVDALHVGQVEDEVLGPLARRPLGDGAEVRAHKVFEMAENLDEHAESARVMVFEREALDVREKLLRVGIVGHVVQEHAEGSETEVMNAPELLVDEVHVAVEERGRPPERVARVL